MPDLAPLHELTARVRPRDLDELRALVRRRRRRTAVLTSAVAAGTAVAVVLLGASLGQQETSPAPLAPEPPPTSTPSRSPESTRTPPEDTVRGPFPTLTPREVKNHPGAVMERSNDIAVTAAPGVAARMWTVCLADCSRETTYQEGEMQRALEVTNDDFSTSDLFPYVPPEPNVSHAVDDWFALSSIEDAALVNAQGDVRPLTDGASVPASEIAGPLIYASTGVAYVDLESFELHPVQGGGYWDWWGAGDTWFWGSVYQVEDSGDVVQQGLTWRNRDGSFGVHLLPFPVTEWSTQTLRSDRPGTMGAIEPGLPRLLHVSTDYGETWGVRIMPGAWGTGTSLPDDWRTWVDVWPTWPKP